MRKLFVLIFISVFTLGFAQQAEIFKINKYKVSNLSDSLQESSGLHFFKDQLFTFNDGGNSEELFLLNPETGKIQKKIPLKIPNLDWEALTNDGENFYVGDFGNNAGTRKDLRIYKIPFDKTPHEFQTINFFFPEQKDFASKNLNTVFDVEAMIFCNGKIHFFTKEWNSKSTTHYTLDPNQFELQEAKKIEKFNTDFIVTDASLFDSKLYLIGYTKKTEVFLQIFEISEEDLFLKNPIKKYYLGSTLSLSQIEGIAVSKEGIYISGEKFYFPLGTTSQKFFHIPLEKLK